MNWRTSLQQLGLDIPAQVDVTAALLMLTIIIVIAVLGWLIGSRLMPRVLAGLPESIGHPDSLAARLLSSAAQYGFMIIAFLIVRQTIAFPPLSLVLLAAAIALAAATLASRLVAASRFSSPALTSFSFLAVLGLTAIAAFGGAAPLTSLLDSIGFNAGTHRISLLSASTLLGVAIGLYLFAQLALTIFSSLISRSASLDASQQLLATKLVGITITVAAVLIGIDAVGIDLKSLAIFSGALGLAVGFGLQKTLGNLIAGVILLMDRSIKPGDVIVVEDTFGWVDKIGVRAVSIVTRDGKEHLIPNEKLMTEPVENWSHSNNKVRVHIPVGVSYAADQALAQKLMKEAAIAGPRVLSDPAPNVWMDAWGNSSVDYQILVWITDPEQGVGNVRSDILNRLWILFKENGVEIPFPQLDVHLRSNAAGLGRLPESGPAM